jgi:ribosome-associated protein
MMKAREIALLGAFAASEKKASGVVMLDVGKLTSFTDYFLICTGDTDVQIRAIADAIVGDLKKRKIRVLHVEGYENAKWVLLDYGDVVVHIFNPELREFYQLEKLWADAPKETIRNEG